MNLETSFDNLTWIDQSFLFSSFKINACIEIQNSRLNFNPGLKQNQTRTTGPFSLTLGHHKI